MILDEKYLTPRDAAALLGCSPDQVIRLAQKGQIRVADSGRFWRFRHTDIVEYRERVASSSGD
jgi:excisionase family DNA binding protein